MTIGVGVEGPSDWQFWSKVLPKHFRGCRFDVRNMKNRDKLIRESPKLLETFRDCRYRAGFILVDLDNDPCLTAVLDLFGASIKTTARQPRKDARFLHVCIAKKEIESWYLADAVAINAVIPGAGWTAPADTESVTKGTLRTLVKSRWGKNASFNVIDFAQTIAPKFDPTRAQNHSASFRYFWEIMETKVRTR